MPTQAKPNLPPNGTDYVVFALAKLESRIDSLEEASRERAARNQQRFDDFLAAAQQRGKLYEQRDHEWSRQLAGLVEQLTPINAALARFGALDDDVKALSIEIHDLRTEYHAFDDRMRTVEACKRAVEDHFALTEGDHKAISGTRAALRFLAWLAALIGTVLMSVGGIMPIIERFWPPA